MRRDRQRIQDAIEAIDAAIEFLKGIELAEFLEDDKTRSAVLHKLLVVGEACARVSTAVRERHPDAPWLDAIRLRNVIAHEYFVIDWPTIWGTARDDLPEFRAFLAELRDTLPADG